MFEIYWTNHAENKLRFYRLSKQRILRVLNSPKRIEEGIAPNTVAMMQPASVKTVKSKQIWSQEIWVMVNKTSQMSKVKCQKLKIISAWRYPGMTKSRSKNIIDILRQEYSEYNN